MLKKFFYYVNWGAKCKLGGKKIPLSSSIIITDKCNLNCKHCSVAHLGYPELSFEEVKRQIDYLFSTGSRMLVITGGEPFLWCFNEITLDDVVKYSKKLGFFRVVICTNGTFPLESSADYLWVSMDGAEEVHNSIRGDISRRVWNNINQSTHNRIYINFTISRINQDTFIENAKEILNNKKVKGILFHIFTPYINSDKSLLLTSTEQKIVLKQLLKFKREHPIKVSNTFDGIKNLMRNNWSRPIWSSIVINQNVVMECCCREGISNKEICELCGCSPAVESYVLEKLYPLAIIENFRFL